MLGITMLKNSKELKNGMHIFVLLGTNFKQIQDKYTTTAPLKPRVMLDLCAKSSLSSVLMSISFRFDKLMLKSHVHVVARKKFLYGIHITDVSSSIGFPVNNKVWTQVSVSEAISLS